MNVVQYSGNNEEKRRVVEVMMRKKGEARWWTKQGPRFERLQGVQNIFYSTYDKIPNSKFFLIKVTVKYPPRSLR